MKNKKTLFFITTIVIFILCFIVYSFITIPELIHSSQDEAKELLKEKIYLPFFMAIISAFGFFLKVKLSKQ